jgi:hypothetical protein
MLWEILVINFVNNIQNICHKITQSKAYFEYDSNGIIYVTLYTTKIIPLVLYIFYMDANKYILENDG